MTKKRAASLSKEERLRLREIKVRHGSADSIEKWAACGATLKDQVISELEETMRVVRENAAEYSEALGLAIAALDTTSVPGALGTAARTHSDIQWLLERVPNQTDG